MATKKMTTIPVEKKPTPKFGEVGYKFNIGAEIVEVNDENDTNNYPFTVSVDMGVFEDLDYEGDSMFFNYCSREDLLKLASKTNPKLLLDDKKAELKKAQEVVDRITKEINALSK